MKGVSDLGYYIQTTSAHDKARYIVANYGGQLLTTAPKTYASIPQGKALIVVLDNGPFEAAGFCYDAGEFEAFTYSGDARPKQYVLIDRVLAEQLTGYAK